MSVIVSVCMLTYGHQNYILDAVKSVINQKTNFIFELLIFDDCSPDSTEEIISSVNNYNTNLNIKYIRHTKNIGANKNFSLALKTCLGKYIAICEGDDFWLDRNKLQNQFDFLELNPQFVFCGSQISIVKSDACLNDMTSLPYTLYCKGKSYNYEDICLSNRIPTVTVFFRNHISSISLDLIENSPHGDWPLWVSILNVNKKAKIFVSNSTTSSYRVHNKGMYSMVDDEKKKLNTSKTAMILNEITKGVFSKYYYLLCQFLLKNNSQIEDFFKTNFKNIDLNDNMIIQLQKAILDSSLIEYSYTFNKIYSQCENKNQILQLYKECKPSSLVYLFPNYINFNILKKIKAYFWARKNKIIKKTI